MLGVDRDAEARLDLERQAVEHERLLERLVDARCQHHRVLDRPRREEDPELVAAEPCERVALAQQLAQAGRQLLEQPVARLVAERVVDLAEVVDVEQQDGRRLPLPARAQDRLSDPVSEERAVREAGELVVERAVLDLLHLALDPPRHAPEDRHEDDEEEDEHELEDPRDREERRLGRLRDRRVVLEELDDAGSTAHGDRRVHAQRLPRLGALAAGGGARDVAADRSGTCFAQVREVGRFSSR